MRVTLVDNLLYEDLYTVPKYDLQPHLGLLSLVSVARAKGHDAQIYDPKLDLVHGVMRLDRSLYSDFATRILDHGPDVVGFTALGCNFNCVIKVASYIKRRRPDLPILLGGPHATILHREILNKFAAFDVIVRNEAEQTFPALLERLDGLELNCIEGVSYRNHRGETICNPGSPTIEDLDALPMPSYDCYPLGELGLRSIRVEAGRGCPFSCTFCSTASFFGRNYRLKTASRLLAEMDHLHEKYGFTDFKLNHDLFTVNRKKVVEFCETMLDRNYNWGCSARVDCVDHDLLDLMSRAGCSGIYFGIETGSRRIQETSRKRLDLDLVRPTVDYCNRLGIKTVTSFITGYPDEEEDDQKQTVDMVGDFFCRPDGMNVSQLHLLTPEPGTQMMLDHGHCLKFDGHVTDFNFPTLEPDDREILKDDPVIFGNHHYFPSLLPRERLVFVTSAWNAFRLVGRVTLAQTLREFDGSLSQFFDELRAWCNDRFGRIRAVSVKNLVDFICCRFGTTHYLVSLFRYALAVREVRNFHSFECGTKLQGLSQDVPLLLGPSARLLRDIHDCVEILEGITQVGANERLDGVPAEPTATLLIVRDESGEMDDPEVGIGVRVFLVDQMTADLLSRFAEAKSYWRCCQEIADAGVSMFPDWLDVEKFAQMGVLVPPQGFSDGCCAAAAE